MSIFYAQMSDGSSMKKKADKMELVDDSIRVYLNGDLVAYVDVGATLYAHIHDGKEKNV